MKISGLLLEVERKSGDFVPDGSTEKIAFDYTVLHVLDGIQVRKVRLPKGVHAHPFEVETMIELEVEVNDNVQVRAVERKYLELLSADRAA